MKVIYIGGNHAGTLSMKELKSKYPEVEITLYEENTRVSFLACGIALSLSGVVKDMEELFYSSLEELELDGIKVYQEHKVIKVEPKLKQIKVKNLVTNETFVDTYDKLVVATGSWPIIPNILGINSKNVHLAKTYLQAKTLLEYSKDVSIKNVSVVGAGYIGIELAEAFSKQGKKVTLIDSCNTLLDKYYNEDIAKPLLEELGKHNISLELNQSVEKFITSDEMVTKIITSKNKKYSTDLVIMCVGFRPNTNIFKDVVDLTKNGAIKTDIYRYTSDDNILAIGDCATINNNATSELYSYIALASNAIRTGICAANNIFSKNMPFIGVQGANGLSIFGHNLASVGISKNNAQKFFKINADDFTFEDHILPDFMPTNKKVKLNISYDRNNGRIIGAQIYSHAKVDDVIHFFSLAIQEQKTLNELVLTDLLFLPHYNKPLNYIFVTIMNARKQWLSKK